MPWYVQQDSSPLAFQKSAVSPGSGWLLINGAGDSDSQAQALQQLLQDIANGDYGSSVGNGLATAAGDAANAVTGGKFGDVESALTAFYRTVTDGKLWRSLGWLLLGVALLITGIGLLIGPAAARRSPVGVAADFARKAYG